VRVGEVSVECDGQVGFAGFGFLAAGRKPRLVEPKTTHREETQVARSKDGGWVYAE
jgi:hypothetical protein